MSDDIRAAAARLRLSRQGPHYEPYGFKHTQWLFGMHDQDIDEAIRKDECLLADAYLAEHPADDGEAICDDWIRSVGFAAMGINGYSILLPGHNDNCDPVELYLGHDEEDDGNRMVSLLQSNANDHVLITSKLMRTRGDLRLLLKAIGLELRETKGT